MPSRRSIASGLSGQGADSNGMVAYRLALLWWQKAGMLGFSGVKDQELTLLSKAREALRGVEEMGTESGVPPEELQRSSAYLLGDYAHALELADKTKEAKETFREAMLTWERLTKVTSAERGVSGRPGADQAAVEGALGRKRNLSRLARGSFRVCVTIRIPMCWVYGRFSRISATARSPEKRNACDGLGRNRLRGYSGDHLGLIGFRIF